VTRKQVKYDNHSFSKSWIGFSRVFQSTFLFAYQGQQFHRSTQTECARNNSHAWARIFYCRHFLFGFQKWKRQPLYEG
jgi:hypothetical protein